MRKIVSVVVVVIALAAALVWKLRHRGESATPATTSINASHGPQIGNPAAAATPASLSGRVTRKTDGVGIANAVVAISSSNLIAAMMSEAPPVIVVTDATGAWIAPTLPPAAYIVTATAAGYLPTQLPKLWLTPGEQHTGVVIAMDPGGTLLHGKVSDVGGGPINGAHVTVSRSSALELDTAELVAITGADGTYVLSLADGAYEAVASHDEYTQARHEVELAGKPVVADFVLVPGAVVHGQVIARDTGKPVPNAEISAGDRNATADADGAFSLRGLHSGVVSITAVARGYASNTPTTLEIGIGEQIDGIRVLVDHALSISGTVVRKGGHVAIPGVMVGVFSVGSGRQAKASAPSDAHGAFEIIGVRPASYIVFALGENTVPEIGKSVVVADRDVTGVEVEMGVGVTLVGRVEPPQVASVGVTLAGDVGLANMMDAMKTMAVHGESDATGAFVLHNVPAGALKLGARTADGHVGSLPILVAEVDQSGLVVVLEARASVSGRVVDTSNAPVAGFEVAANSQDEHRSSITFSAGPNRTGATTAADGTFKIVGLEAGKYEIVASDPADRRTTDKDAKKETIELAAGAERTGVVLTVEARDGVIRGQVIGGDRRPAPDAWVTANRAMPSTGITPFDSDGEGDSPEFSSEPVLTGADGTFTISRLAHGEYTVIAEGPRGGARAEKHGVKTGDSVTLELQPLGTLTGHVTLGGAPVIAYDISCRGPAGPIDRDVAAADGAYSLEHLAPGSYSCEATSTGGANGGTASGKVDVPAASAQLDLAMVPWASISGVVASMFSGAPVPGVVAITGMSGKEIGAAIVGTAPKSDASGRFELDQIGAGSGTLMLMDPSSMFGQLASRPYSASPGQHIDLGTIKIVPPRVGDAGTLGMTVSEAGSALSVTAVKAGGPAEAAGIKVGDKIVAIDGHAVSELGVTASAQFLSSGQIGVGEVVQLSLERGVQATVTSIRW